MNIRTRFALIVTLWSALALLMVSGALYLVVDRFLYNSQQERLLAATRKIWAVFDPIRWDWKIETSPTFPKDLEWRLVEGLNVVDHSPQFPEMATLLKPGMHEHNDRLVLVQTVSGLGTRATLALATTPMVLTEPRQAYLRAMAVTLPPALLLVALAGWLTAGRLLRPIRALEQSAREMGDSGDLSKRVPYSDKNDELGRLAQTLQNSFQQLGQIREREKEFTRAAAHDLRSPLTALQTRIQATLARERDPERYKTELREIGADVERLSKLTSHLLLLARDPSSLSFRSVILSHIAAEAVDRAREQSPDTSIDFIADDVGEVAGDGVLLSQMLENLLQNALRHAPGAPILVSLKRQEGGIALSVADQGPGVAADVLGNLGQAFYRPDSARSGGGNGLGLAIVRHIAGLHGGNLTLVSQPNQGFGATVFLPKMA